MLSNDRNSFRSFVRSRNYVENQHNNPALTTGQVMVKVYRIYAGLWTGARSRSSGQT